MYYQYFPISYFVENSIILSQNIAFCTSLAVYETSILLSNTSTSMQAVPKHVAFLNINIHFSGDYSYIHVARDLIEVGEFANCY